MQIEEKIKSLGLVLFPPPAPAGNYIGAVTYGKLVYLAGHGPSDAHGHYLKGKVPTAVSVDEAYDAARMVGLNMLSTLKLKSATSIGCAASSKFSAWSMLSLTSSNSQR